MPILRSSYCIRPIFGFQIIGVNSKIWSGLCTSNYITAEGSWNTQCCEETGIYVGNRTVMKKSLPLSAKPKMHMLLSTAKHRTDVTCLLMYSIGDVAQKGKSC